MIDLRWEWNHIKHLGFRAWFNLVTTRSQWHEIPHIDTPKGFKAIKHFKMGKVMFVRDEGKQND